MIKVEKSLLPPTVLATKGKTATAQLIAQYEAEPQAHHLTDGKSEKDIRKFEFDSGIYGHPKVKNQLKIDQHSKCCYCESAFTGTSYGDVEHFRPKAAYNPGLNLPLSYPGYFWLAYEWRNLLFSCQICNQQFKKNHFALLDEDKRAKPLTNVAVLLQEGQLLIDLCQENPEDHVTFQNEVVRPKAGSLRGEYMIKVYGLDRPVLVEERERRFKEINTSMAFASIDLNDTSTSEYLCQKMNLDLETLKTLVMLGKKTISNAACSQAPYAAMVRANFPKLPRA
jgi:uncharacterized protein (TIGR02646 family)